MVRAEWADRVVLAAAIDPVSFPPATARGTTTRRTGAARPMETARRRTALVGRRVEIRCRTARPVRDNRSAVRAATCPVIARALEEWVIEAALAELAEGMVSAEAMAATEPVAAVSAAVATA